MKWIWFLLFLAIIGEIMDTMDMVDAAKKKKKKKITKKKKKAKAKAKGKKKPTRKTTTTRRPAMGGYDPSLIFYSPMPSNFSNTNGGALPIDTYDMPISGQPLLKPIPYTAPLPSDAANIPILPASAIIDQNSLRKNAWFKMTRQRRSVEENPMVLEYLGLLESGKTKEFGEVRPKRSIRMLKVASVRQPGENDTTDAMMVDENNNFIKEPITEVRRKRAVDSENNTRIKDKMMKDRQEEAKDKMQGKREGLPSRPKREAPEQKIKDMQPKKNDLKELDRPKRDVIKEKTDPTQAKKNEIKDKINRPKRDIKSQVDKVKEKLKTRRENQQEKRKEKKEQQEAKRNERRNSMNAKRNGTQAGQPEIMPRPDNPEGPTFEAQVTPNDARYKRAIDLTVPSVQDLDTDTIYVDEDDSSYYEECFGEDCSSDESFDDSTDEILSVEPNTEEVRLKRETPKDRRRDPSQMTVTLPTTLPSRSKRQAGVTNAPNGEDCTGEDCSSEECVGDDCTYEDSDSEEDSEEKIVVKREVDENSGPVDKLVRERRQIGKPKHTVIFMGGCDGDEDDYGGDYGTYDDTEERRRRRNRKRNNRNNRKDRKHRNNKRNNRKNKQPNRRLQSPNSFDQTTNSPFNIPGGTPSNGFPTYLPHSDLSVTPSSSLGMNTEPFMVNMAHPLRKRELSQVKTTQMPSRTTVRTRSSSGNLERQKREIQTTLTYSLLPIEESGLKPDLTKNGTFTNFGLLERPKREMPSNNKPEGEGKRSKEAQRKSRPPVDRNEELARTKRHASANRSENQSGQPRPNQERREGKDPSNQRPPRQRNTPDRLKREIDPLFGVQRSMPISFPSDTDFPKFIDVNEPMMVTFERLPQSPGTKVKRQAPKRQSEELRPTLDSKQERERFKQGNKRPDRQKRGIDRLTYHNMPSPIPSDAELAAMPVVNGSYMQLKLPTLPEVSEINRLIIYHPLPEVPSVKVKRQAPTRQPEEQILKPEGKQERAPEKKRPDRQKRDIDQTLIIRSPVPMSMPKLSDEELSALWKNVNMTMPPGILNYTDAILISIPDSSLMAQSPKVKRGAPIDRLQNQPKGPRENQRNRSQSERTEAASKRPDRQRRDLDPMTIIMKSPTPMATKMIDKFEPPGLGAYNVSWTYASPLNLPSPATKVKRELPDGQNRGPRPRPDEGNQGRGPPPERNGDGNRRPESGREDRSNRQNNPNRNGSNDRSRRPNGNEPNKDQRPAATTFMFPKPAVGRAGSVLAGAMKILAEYDNGIVQENVNPILV